MIRWYDYPVAFLAADFLWANLQTALFGGLFWAPIGALGAYFVWMLWEDTYIPWRVGQERDTD